MHDLGLADRIRAKGVTVVEVAGWRSRGRGDYDPDGAVHHHTAGGPHGAVPSLATVIHGRPGIPGPLCNVLQSREANPAHDKAFVIAAGRANHAGKGGWRGLSGNRKMGGLEVEHTGNGPVPVARLEISARILAALMEAPGSSRSAANVCQHAEWAPTRKVDFRSLAPFTPDSFRHHVAALIGRAIQEDDMPYSPEQITNLVMSGVSKAMSTEGSPARVGVSRVVEKTMIEILSKEGNPVRVKIRELARMGAEDALKEAKPGG
jgi:N-acetylmuramoyl-L-alanine amidase